MGKLLFLVAALALQTNPPADPNISAINAASTALAAEIASYQTQIATLQAQLTPATSIQALCPNCLVGLQTALASMPAVPAGQTVWMGCSTPTATPTGNVVQCVMELAPTAKMPGASAVKP